MTEKLVLGVRVGGKNGPALVLTGETKEDAVGQLRAFVRGTSGADLVLTIKGIRAFDNVILKADEGVLAWRCHGLNRIFLNEDFNQVETFAYPLQAINEFCFLAYHEGLWSDETH